MVNKPEADQSEWETPVQRQFQSSRWEMMEAGKGGGRGRVEVNFRFLLDRRQHLGDGLDILCVRESNFTCYFWLEYLSGCGTIY